MLLNKHHHPPWFLGIFLFVFTSYASAQNDTTVSVKPDTTITPKKSKEKYQRKDAYIFYGGINFNELKVSSSTYESISEAGWHLGFMYKRESFFYWQIGARLNNAKYNLHEFNSTDTTSGTFSVADLDIPVTGGINILPVTKRVVNVHVFVSAVPVFELKVGDNSLGIAKDKTNTFRFYGQAGVGVDVFFLVLEGGFNFGFNDLLKNAESKPNQAFISLGFRF